MMSPTDNSLLYSGRVQFSDPSAPRFQWPLTSVTVMSVCNRNSTVSFAVSATELYTRWRFLLDGSGPALNAVGSGARNLTFHVPAGKHTLTLLKDAECLRCGPTLHLPPFRPVPGGAPSFLGVAIDNACTLSAPPRKARKVEVVGDSISCGFGNGITGTLAQKAECTAAAAAADVINRPPEYMYDVSSAHDSYAGQLATRFDAEIHLQCISGIGMCKNGLSLGARDAYNMSRYLDRTLPFSPGANSWDYSSWTPDLVVINLGTNDYIFKGVETAPTQSAFESAYVSFAKRLLDRYETTRAKGGVEGGALPKLLLVCGPMTLYQCPYVANVAANLTSAGYVAAFANATLPKSPSGLSGCAGHPDKAEATAVVERISGDVRDLMGWTMLPE